MSAVSVERLTVDEARARRLEIIAIVGEEDALRRRAAQYLLDAGEQALFDELEDLDYLLSV
ncbi:MAG TPA: hypothetical protein VHO27_02110 [Angustibacter sp.]|nr:hypothetical protein [Angustibacter sp.]